MSHSTPNLLLPLTGDRARISAAVETLRTTPASGNTYFAPAFQIVSNLLVDTTAIAAVFFVTGVWAHDQSQRRPCVSLNRFPFVPILIFLTVFLCLRFHIFCFHPLLSLIADGESSAKGSDDVQALALANAMRARGVEIYAVSQGPKTNPAYMQQIGTHACARAHSDGPGSVQYRVPVARALLSLSVLFD